MNSAVQTLQITIRETASLMVIFIFSVTKEEDMKQTLDCLKNGLSAYMNDIKRYTVIGGICLLPILLSLIQAVFLPQLHIAVSLIIGVVGFIAIIFMLLMVCTQAYNSDEKLTFKELFKNAHQRVYRTLNVAGRILLVYIGAAVVIALFWGIVKVSYTAVNQAFMLWGTGVSIAAACLIIIPRYGITFVSAAVGDWEIRDTEHCAKLFSKNRKVCVYGFIFMVLIFIPDLASGYLMDTYASLGLSIGLIAFKYIYLIFALPLVLCVWTKIYQAIEDTVPVS